VAFQLVIVERVGSRYKVRFSPLVACVSVASRQEARRVLSMIYSCEVGSSLIAKIHLM